MKYNVGFKNPTGIPLQAGEASTRATSAAHIGAAMLVPPIVLQPPQPLQWMTSPVFGSASAETSGTSRQNPVGTPQGLPEE